MPLTLEERGALMTVAELAAERGGFVPDQERWLSGWMQCSVRKWRLIRAALIAKGKLVIGERAGEAGFVFESGASHSRTNVEPTATHARKVSETETKPNENSRPKEPPLARVEDISPRLVISGSVSASGSAGDLDWPETEKPNRAYLDSLEAALREAAGPAINAAAPKLAIVAPILALAKSGAGPPCDLQADVLPAVRACAARTAPGSVSRWDYFVPAITEARDRRLRGAPATGPSHERPNANLPTVASSRAARRGVWAEVLAEERGQVSRG